MKFLLSTMALATCIELGCSSDGGDFAPWQLDDLQDTNGFSLRAPEYEVPAGHESQNCYFVRVPDIAGGQDIWIDRVLTAINPGSHHVNVFQVKTIVALDPAKGTPVMLGKYQGTVVEGGDDYKANPCWSNANWADWPFIANSQQANPDNLKTDWKLPEGVAIRLTPGEMLMVQTHYVNSTDQPTTYGARVGINFYRYQKTAAPIELGALTATQRNIRICASQPTPMFSGTCRFPSDVTVSAANGHFHKRGQRFTMSAWDGASLAHPADGSRFYESLNWNEPPMTTDLNIKVPANAGVWWDCNFQWQTPTGFSCADLDAKDAMQQNDCCYTFGGNTDLSEHCNAFIYYYPKTESSVVCAAVP
jgi:hypothetical protein